MRELEQLTRKTYRLNRSRSSVYLDIDLDFYTDLYNEWDFSPHRRRDLDVDLFNYLIECSEEIPLAKDIVIRLHLPESIHNEEKELTAKEGIKRYISYQIRKNRYLRKKSFRGLLLYGLTGTIFLSGGVLLNKYLPTGTLQTILNEGLIIGGWVLFWECFSIVFFEDKLMRSKTKHLGRLLKSSLEFIYH